MRYLLWLLVTLLVADPAMAVYSSFSGRVQDKRGNSISAAKVYVYDAGTTTEIDLYDGPAGAVTANPISTDEFGRFTFYAAYGTYDLSISRVGITTYTVEDVQLFDADLSTGVGSSQITDYSIATADLDTASVTDLSIADSTITYQKLARSGSAGYVLLRDNTTYPWKVGQLDSAAIDSGIIRGMHILDDTIDLSKLAAGAATDSQIIKFDTATGMWKIGSDATGGAGSGDIDGVTAGTGLSGGGVSGTVTVNVATDGIDSTLIADSAVHTYQIVNGTVDNVDVEDSTLSYQKLGRSGTVGQVLLRDNTTFPWAVGQVDSNAIGASSVTSQAIKDGEINTADLAAASVTAAKIANDAVTGRTIDRMSAKSGDVIKWNASVTEWEAADDETGAVADSSITTVKLGGSAVTSAKISNGAILAVDLGTNCVSAAKLADDAVDSNAVLDGNVTASKLAADCITVGKYGAGSIDSTAIGTDAITPTKLKGNSVLQGHVAFWFTGTGTPEASVTADSGSVYFRLPAVADSTLYVKMTGAGNTGWVPLTHND